jgi:hypothetical protein
MKKTFALLLAFCAACLFASAVFAVPALERVFTVKQPDGYAFEVFTRGDERAHWTVSDSDGYILAQDDDHWWCYALVANGRLKPSRVRYYKNTTPPKGAVKNFTPKPRFNNGG